MLKLFITCPARGRDKETENRVDRACHFVDAITDAEEAELYAMMVTLLDYMRDKLHTSKLEIISKIIFKEIIE